MHLELRLEKGSAGGHTQSNYFHKCIFKVTSREPSLRHTDAVADFAEDQAGRWRVRMDFLCVPGYGWGRASLVSTPST